MKTDQTEFATRARSRCMLSGCVCACLRGRRARASEHSASQKVLNLSKSGFESLEQRTLQERQYKDIPALPELL